MDDPVSEETVYNVTITVNTEINDFQYKAVYAYRGDVLSNAGASDPTIYNIATLQSGGIMNASEQAITEPFVYTTQITIPANRSLAVLFYRDYQTCITSVTAYKEV